MLTQITVKRLESVEQLCKDFTWYTVKFLPKGYLSEEYGVFYFQHLQSAKAFATQIAEITEHSVTIRAERDEHYIALKLVLDRDGVLKIDTTPLSALEISRFTHRRL